MGSLYQFPAKGVSIDVSKAFPAKDAMRLAKHTLENGLYMTTLPYFGTAKCPTSFKLRVQTTQVVFNRDAAGVEVVLYIDFSCVSDKTGRWLYTVPCYWSSILNKFVQDRVIYSGDTELLYMYADEMVISRYRLQESYEQPFLNGLYRHLNDALKALMTFVDPAAAFVVEDLTKDMFPEEPRDTEWSVLD